ncbi:MAG: apolipoprotein N-acyltransferase [Thermodesulfobacteriota bacterium]
MAARSLRHGAPASAGSTGHPWRAFALALLSGLLLYFASPGAGGWAGLAWFALVPLLVTLRGVSPRTATLLGLTCGLAFYLPLLAWIITVLATYGQVHPAVAATALLLLALYMALYLALFSRWFCMAPARHLLWFAPALWVGLDVTRGWLFTGFPWQDLGYSQYTLLPLIQLADLLGHHGVTFAIVLANTVLGLLLLRRSDPERQPLPDLLPLATAALLLVLCLGYGLLRLGTVNADLARQPRLPVAVIQGNIPQDQKWAPDYQEATVREYVDLSGTALARQPESLVVWPETALPFYPLENSLFLRLTDLTRAHRACLLTGAPHREPDPEQGVLRYSNSSFLIGPDGRVIGQYHKQHLVPFGEYIPLRRILPFFAPIVETLGDFTPGDSRAPLICGTARLGVLICFESIFPELARESTALGANLLVNLTNDAWFGRSTAPWQHLSMAVFRAVENRRSLVRAANTGVSGIILPTGAVRESTTLFTAASRTAQVPLLATETIYALAGHFFGLLCFGLALCGIVGTIRTTKRTRSRVS